MTDKTLGQVAFEAYRDQLQGSRPWSDVREPERLVWEATARAVANEARAEQQRDDADVVTAEIWCWVRECVNGPAAHLWTDSCRDGYKAPGPAT